MTEVTLGPLNADESTETKKNARAKTKLRRNVMFVRSVDALDVKVEATCRDFRDLGELGLDPFMIPKSSSISECQPKQKYRSTTILGSRLRVNVKLLVIMFESKPECSHSAGQQYAPELHEIR